MGVCVEPTLEGILVTEPRGLSSSFMLVEGWSLLVPTVLVGSEVTLARSGSPPVLAASC